MRQGSNRRLANVKTRRETGLDFIMQNMELGTPFGKKVLKETKPYYPGEEQELIEELDRLEKMVGFVKDNQILVEKLEEVFMEMKDASLTLKRSESTILSMVELYEIKALLLQMRTILKLAKDGDKELIPQEYILKDTEDILDVLDPSGDRINTFYIYDEFSETLKNLRGKKREIELEIRREQKQSRDELRRKHGVQLTPKFDIVVAKSHPDIDKIQALEELEVADQDYMSITFRLKATEAVYKLISDIENINLEIEQEEERIRGILSQKIAEHAAVLNENCEKIGELDFALAKAGYAVKHNLTKPEIVTEHIIEFTDGRNLQVESILRGKGKTYCPVSISLKDGVTVITGANMGGKTISLKLSGQVPILAQYGFFVPAASAKIGLSNYMQIIIGDSQSVERGLSSFGSEMEELKEVFDRGQERSLILIDEIASGTNPSEGTALTRSIVDYLIQQPYISLITTHFETVTEGEGVVNMQVRGLTGCDFSKLYREIKYAKRSERINIISKYMDYRLYKVDDAKQVPKDALNIAAMLGIDSGIIEGAKKYLK